MLDPRDLDTYNDFDDEPDDDDDEANYGYATCDCCGREDDGIYEVYGENSFHCHACLRDLTEEHPLNKFDHLPF